MRAPRLVVAASATALALTVGGCSPDTVGTPTEPAPYGTPVRITVDSAEVDYTVTWEIVVEGIEPAPFKSDGYADAELEDYPGASCWIVTATWTQIDGPATGTEIPVSVSPWMEGSYPDGTEAVDYASNACDFFTADLWRGDQYTPAASIDEAPGNGQTMAVGEPIASIIADKPSTIRIRPFGESPESASYVDAAPDQ